METVTLREYRSPFRHTEPKLVIVPFEGKNLAEIRKENLPEVIKFVASIDGRIYKEDRFTSIIPKPSDRILIVPDIGDDDIAAIAGLVIAVIAVVISGGGLGPAALGWFGSSFAAGGMGAMLAGLGVSILGGLAISMLRQTPSVATMDSYGGYDTTQTYSWQPQTTQQQGGAIPRMYGTNQAYGNIVAWSIETINDKQYLNVLISLGIGPVSRVYNHMINDQPVDNYSGVEIHTRLGLLDQDPIPNFTDIKRECTVNQSKVVYDTPVIYTTPDSDFNGLEVDVTFPYGLYYANNSGGLDAYAVDLRIEVKLQGTDDWLLLTQQSGSVNEIVYDGVWSAGCWVYDQRVDGMYWYEYEAGSDDPSDHREGESYPGMGQYYWRWIETSIASTVATVLDYITVKEAKNTSITRTYKIDNLEYGTYDIRVTNLTADQTSSRYGDDLYLTGVREVYYDDFEYPRTVLVGIKALATDQLSGSLRYSCYVDGALVRVQGNVLSSGSIASEDMRLSVLDGHASVDASTADILTDYVGKRLIVRDSEDNEIYGYIKEATSDIPSSMPGICAGSSTVYAEWEDQGMWRHDTGWSMIHATTPLCMCASGSLLFVSFSGQGLWKYDGTTWTKLNTDEPTAMSAYGTWLIYNTNHAYKYNLSTGVKTQISSAQATKISIADDDIAYFKFTTPLNHYKYVISTGVYTAISGAEVGSFWACGAICYATFPGWANTYKWNGSSWDTIKSGYAATAGAVVNNTTFYAALSDGIYQYISGTTWTKISSDIPTMMTGSAIKLYAYFDATKTLKSWDGAHWETVLEPSSTGVTITAEPDGTTYNWTSVGTGFNDHDEDGYTYVIDNFDIWATEFSNRPAWIGYDVLTRPVLDNDGNVIRYDGYKPAKVDLDSHLDLAEYNDTEVSDGNNGTEALCCFDGVFDSRTTIWDALLKIYAAGRAIPYYEGTKITIAINMPDPAPTRFVIGMGNIIQGSFKEQWSSIDQRPCELTVEILNRDNNYAREPKQIIHPDFTSGVQPLNMEMFGITRESQAWRDGMLRLNSNKELCNTAEVIVPIEGIETRIGKVVEIAHDVPLWGYSGRLVSATSTTVTIDREISLAVGKSYGIKIKLKNNAIVYRAVSGQNSTTELVVASAFDDTEEYPLPAQYDNYIFNEIGKIGKPFRVLAMQPDMDYRIKLSCLEYNETVYNYDSGAPVLTTPNYSSLARFPSVTSLTVSEKLIKRPDGTIDEVVDIYFDRPDNFIFAFGEIWYQKDGANWRYAGKTETGVFQMPVVALSGYWIKAVTVNTAGERQKIQDAPQTYIIPLGKTAKPSDPTGFSATVTEYGIRLSWNPVIDVDLYGYEIRQNDNVIVTDLQATSYTVGLLAAGTYNYTLQSLDTTDNYCETPATAQVIISNPSALSISYSFVGEDVVFTWSKPTSQYAIDHYRITATGQDIRAYSTQYRQKINWTGSKTFTFKAVDVAGNESSGTNSTVTVQAPSVVQNLQLQIIDNTVLFTFSEPATHSLPVSKYEFRKGSTFATADVVGMTVSTFHTYFETQAGEYTYWIVPIDSAGNYGAETSIIGKVNAPPDFVFKADYHAEGAWSGDKTNCVASLNGELYAPIETDETWAQHFGNNSWDTIADQISAGYPLYGQPTPSTGSYEETWDYGALIASSKITITISRVDLSGAVIITPTISVSDDGESWTDYEDVWETYAQNFQYVKVKLDFSNDSDPTMMVKLSALSTRVDVKLRSDSGNGACDSGDGDGTQFDFNVDFLDVDSIVATPMGTADRRAIVNFTDTPNPTGFKVLLFDSSGNRVSGDISWQAKGV